MSSHISVELSADRFSGSARYVGRVGALAFVLGVGAAISAIPTAWADMTGSAGASASDSAGPVKTSPRSASDRVGAVSDSRHRGSDTPAGGITAGTSAALRQPVAGGVSGAGADKVARLAPSGGGDAPIAEPLALTVLAVSRPGSGSAARLAVTAAAVSTSGGGPSGAVVASPSAAAAAQQPVTVLRFFIGDGTAEIPNAGILFGTGYTYTQYEGACLSGACNGGNGGLIINPE